MFEVGALAQVLHVGAQQHLTQLHEVAMVLVFHCGGVVGGGVVWLVGMVAF